MDATSNEVEGLEVRGYPTLLLYSALETQPVKYAGNKDFEGIKEWIYTSLGGEKGSQREEL